MTITRLCSSFGNYAPMECDRRVGRLAEVERVGPAAQPAGPGTAFARE